MDADQFIKDNVDTIDEVIYELETEIQNAGNITQEKAFKVKLQHFMSKREAYEEVAQKWGIDLPVLRELKFTKQ